MNVLNTYGYKIIKNWLSSKNLQPFTFQQETWQYIINKKSGLVNAPTGCGKTFSVFLGALIQFINEHPKSYKIESKKGLQLLWVTPLRALAKDIGRAMEEVINELGMQWKVGIRNGDTDVAERQKQKRNTPEVLIITPESLHLLLAQKNHCEIFKTLRIIAVDEWHELLGSKRGVQVELALNRIVASCSLQDTSNILSTRSITTSETEKSQSYKVVTSEKQIFDSKSETLNLKLQTTNLSIWGISATIGNLEEAKNVLLAPLYWNDLEKAVIVRANMQKQVDIISVLPDEIEKYPWAGHLGIKLAEKVIPIIEQSNTTLIFINTRGMSEMWYQKLLELAPHLAGALALHHGSVDQELRIWVEEALHSQKLKAVVCTASLDLGVDFRPVDTVVQVGSPKGVARFLQRAGRSGHSPGDISKIFFLPTHSLELVEAAALKQALKEELIENREPMLLCFDVLIQYLCTLAIGDGFKPEEIFEEIKSTHCFSEITKEEWNKVLSHITTGGNALHQYDEFKKVEVENGIYRIKSRRAAMQHRMQIGTIVSEAMLKVKFLSGGYIGMIEEYFISRLSPGDSFTLAGRNLELVGVKDMTVLARKSNAKKSAIPSWEGGRMPLSANLGLMLRKTFDKAFAVINPEIRNQNHSPFTPAFGRAGIHQSPDIELKALQPLFQLQKNLSHIPKSNELLIEHIETKDGYHLFVYPFEGRLVHEAMAALLAYRISKITPITFSIAMNDYGFELLSDKPIPVDDSNAHELFTSENLIEDIQRSVNATEMAKRKFRDIAVIGGLIFQGYPGEQKKTRHVQSSASLLFKVFSEYDPKNLLLRQAYQEVFYQQMEEVRLRNALQRIKHENIIITFPQRLTPFCFPIKVDSMREDLTSEKLEDRVRRMQEQLEKEIY